MTFEGHFKFHCLYLKDTDIMYEDHNGQKSTSTVVFYQNDCHSGVVSNS